MASNLLNVTAFDVYNRMIELNFPIEMARLFQSEMKDGLFNYIFGNEENAIVNSQDVGLIMALVKLIASFSNPYQSKFDDDFKNMPLKLMCEPWPQSMCDVLAAEMDRSRAETINIRDEMVRSAVEYQQTPLISQTVKPARKPMALKELTNLPARTSSSVTSVSKKTSSSIEEIASQPTGKIYEPSGIKVLICNVLVELPRFSVDVENSLNLEEECFQILPQACLELAEFLWQSNLNLRSAGDYKQIANAILFKYEVLNGIINRYIHKGFLNGLPTKPKSSHEHVYKLMQKTFSNLRNQMKKQAKKSIYNPQWNC